MPPSAAPPWVRHLALLLALCTSAGSTAQELIPNGGFEDNFPYCGLFDQSAFANYVADWYSPTAGSPDLFRTDLPTVCFNHALGSSDGGSWGAEQPHTGHSMLAVITYCANCSTETREYAQAQLLQPLVAGTTYHARFFVSRADRCRYATDGLGLLFTDAPPASSNWLTLPFTPQVQGSTVIGTDAGWDLIAGDFTATGPHQFVTIGNFRNDAQVQLVDSGPAPIPYAVYFVDELSLSVAGTAPYITGPTTICAGQSIELTAHNGTATTWYDLAMPGIPLGNATTLSVMPQLSTTYVLVQGTDSVFHTVQVLPAPQVDLGNDTTLCAGATLLLNATSSGATYRWSDGSTAPTLIVSESGTYWVQATLGTCMASDTLVVQYVPGPAVDLGNDTTLCPGATMLLNASTPNGSYLWHDGSTSATYGVPAPGSYSVTVSNGLCSVGDTIQVAYETMPVAIAPVDTILCIGDALRYAFYPPALSWQWQDGGTAQPTYITAAGTYAVTVFTARCVHTAQFTVDTLTCAPLVRMPNVFTPNGDGVNDAFVPLNYRGMATAELIIFNRWGNVLHRTNSLLVGWPGRDVPEGTYFWTVEYTDVRGASGAVSGAVTVLR